MVRREPPKAQGLYDPRHEHDACGMGFVADVAGRRSHGIVVKGMQVLRNLEHRGARGCEEDTGDGAGLLAQLPHRFFAKELEALGIEPPSPGEYGVGMVFLPTGAEDRRACESLFEEVVRAEGQSVLGWRSVPTDDSPLGPTAKASRPVVRQIFVGRGKGIPDAMAFERKLWVIRRRAEKAVKVSFLKERGAFYVSSLSYKTIVYKGMLVAGQLGVFYPDILDPLFESGLAMVHARFSTNTFPSWARAHPYRYLSHNGEINTLRGNINWMRARESLFASDLLGEDMQKVLPVIDEGGSDSAMFDNTLEMLTLTGRSLPHAVMMMVPEPWLGHEAMSQEKKAFYEFSGCLMEPWDGPASIAFTDGIRIGAALDRNGLRPSRYYVTKDGLVVLASEVGVLDIPPGEVESKGRLQPGRMFLVDTEEGRIVADETLKHAVVSEHPYSIWLKENLLALEDIPKGPAALDRAGLDLSQRQRVFGYTREDLRILMEPMASDGNEALGSMGTDTPLAVLSDAPQGLYNYFKQLFAQVTNPPVDAIREELIMSMEPTIGPEGNLLRPSPESARRIKLGSPILKDEELAKLKALDGSGPGGFKATTLPMLFRAGSGKEGLEGALEDLFSSAQRAVAEGCNLIVLTDRGVDRENSPIPALLAVAGLHHDLIRKGNRTRVGLVVETGEPREVHHFALLIGYGAGGVNPYLALETISELAGSGQLRVDPDHAVARYVKAANKGVLKVISKMGISTIQSYCGAQIFEAIGLDRDFVDKYFTWTPSRISGVGLDAIAAEVAEAHQRAFAERTLHAGLPVGGQYQWRRGGEHHLSNPETVHKLQQACRTKSYVLFQEYSDLVNGQSARLCTLRGLMELKPKAAPVPLEDVEPVESILKRFKTGAMSYGSISGEAHEALAIAMNRIGGKSNTGEGGEDPLRFVPDANGDSRSSAIKQVASGRFGVTSLYLVNARELQIKMAQGAKPGEGGQLPGHKVYPWIARVRHSTPGVGLISPPPHHDIYSIEDLAELIYDLKNANPDARISVKLVAEAGVGTVAAGVAKAHADVILISGHDGGTGASPLTSVKHSGVPWELGLAEAHQVLVLNHLRTRVVLETDGQLKTGRDVVIAALLGAEEFGFATAPLVAMGCIMMRACHLNTCPVGIATQDPRLREKFRGDPEHVVTFMRFVAQEARGLMALLGFRTIREMVGHTEAIAMKSVDHPKAKALDLSPILWRPEGGSEPTPSIDNAWSLDTSLVEVARPALERREGVHAKLPIRNNQRAVGTLLGSEITKRYGAEGLPEDTVQLHFQGSAGQSFGAFVPRGVTLTLEGDSNDYIGKGLSGGKIIVYPPARATFKAWENVIVGNVAFYGATSGEAYIHGVAGERFCVRNSGLNAVVEAVGDHGCEYMTGGCVVVLGPTGRNFAAGMSGGAAYVLDEDGDFARRCNKEMVELAPLCDPEEAELVEHLIFRHARYTQSPTAAAILVSFADWMPRFVRVMPKDYKRVLEAQQRVRDDGLTAEAAEMAAFELNARDIARVGGR